MKVTFATPLQATVLFPGSGFLSWLHLKKGVGQFPREPLHTLLALVLCKRPEAPAGPGTPVPIIKGNSGMMSALLVFVLAHPLVHPTWLSFPHSGDYGQ